MTRLPRFIKSYDIKYCCLVERSHETAKERSRKVRGTLNQKWHLNCGTHLSIFYTHLSRFCFFSQFRVPSSRKLHQNQITQRKRMPRPGEHANVTVNGPSCLVGGKPSTFMVTFWATVQSSTNALKFFCNIPLPHSMAISFGEKHVFVIRRQQSNNRWLQSNSQWPALNAKTHHISKKQKPVILRNTWCFQIGPLFK